MGCGRVKRAGMLGSAVAPPNLQQGAIALKQATRQLLAVAEPPRQLKQKLM